VLVVILLVLSALAASLLATGSSGRSSSRQLVNRAPASPAAGTRATFAAVRAAARKSGRRIFVGHSVLNNKSKPLRELRPVHVLHQEEREPLARPVSHVSRQPERASAGGVVQDRPVKSRMPSPALSFDGIAYPGVACHCTPPDTDGEIGQTEYVQVVNDGFQVFNKSGVSLYGPADIATIWSGFYGAGSGPCQNYGDGDPILLYDQLANRWVISQFAAVDAGLTTPPTDECIAVSATNDATGAWYRYDFHLGANFYDYPKLAVWPDAYYMSDIVFDPTGTSYLGPQPFAFNRAAMLTGAPATFITTAAPTGPTSDPYLPADLDGSTPPPAGAPDPFVEWPGNGTYKVYRFHVDWSSPASSRFTLAGAPIAAPFTTLCGGLRNCVPQLGSTQGIDAISDRLMFRAAYRNFGTHESLVTNYTVDSNDVAAVRWIELRHVTSGTPTLFQQSTFQPDSTWRWMGSAAMDASGDIAIGYSASSASIYPQIRWAGRLVTDPLNQLSQGETTMYAGTGSQTDPTHWRWGDYSSMSVDPTDDCTFWYTDEYYATTANAAWRTRIGTFRFASCSKVQQQCVVPKVVGLTLPKARKKIVAAHCEVGKITRKHSTKKKKGRVIAESPKAGKHVDLFSKIRLTVGKG
jgi:hypothetical protein